ncbi:ABC transporter ATP-binding protein [Oryzifoliimicrobium ureilyticus]|uniref:ABC transporter ATP-binding protein n=1 Tax=Oryzifoliimicrobium ureilyticus TaxID=3113724 RepID=UPI00307637D2
MAPSSGQSFAPKLRLDLDQHSEEPVLDARSIAVKFKVEDGIVEAVKDISFQLYRGETIAIVGESGSGKSVTARTVMGLLSKRAEVSPQSSVTYEGKNILAFPEKMRRRLRGDRISMIFQEPMSSLNPIYTIGSQIVEAIRVHRRIGRQEAQARALELLQQVHIPDPEARLKQYPHQLSGGQRQRVMIAMALANNPDILIADEPTTALDVTVQAQILNLLRELQKKLQMAVILITHDLTIVRQFSDYVYVMQHGEMCEHNTTAKLFAAPQHPYTRRLLGSEPHGRPKPLEETAPVLLDASGVRVSFMLRHGSFFKPEMRELVAVDSLGLTLRRHETLGLVGESGSGKTTFGQALLRLAAMESGDVAFDGSPIQGLSRREMRPYRARMQIVFQDPFSSLNPRMTIGQILEEGLIVNGIGESKAERRERVRDALVAAGMPGDILSRFPHEFSGGQRQRIAIARAIALEPEFILLDEPTSALDLSVQAQIIDLLRKLQDERGLSYLFISHDLKVVRALCHRVIVMQHGRIMETGPVEEVLTNPKTDYTARLVKAAFDIA